MSTKTAIVIFSDPKSGTEEALGRLVNALALAYEIKQRNEEVVIIFQATGTRWISEVTKPTHYAHGLYNLVSDKVLGISCACSEVFGAREEAEANGANVLTENLVPGTTGFPPLGRYLAEGYNIVTF
jgi:hypothetical protein